MPLPALASWIVDHMDELPKKRGVVSFPFYFISTTTNKRHINYRNEKLEIRQTATAPIQTSKECTLN
jgi:hypothetical protein